MSRLDCKSRFGFDCHLHAKSPQVAEYGIISSVEETNALLCCMGMPTIQNMHHHMNISMAPGSEVLLLHTYWQVAAAFYTCTH